MFLVNATLHSPAGLLANGTTLPCNKRDWMECGDDAVNEWEVSPAESTPFGVFAS